MKERWILLPNFGNPVQTLQWAARNLQDTQRSFSAGVPNLLGNGGEADFLRKSWCVRRDDARSSQTCRGEGITASCTPFLLGISENQREGRDGGPGGAGLRICWVVDYDQLVGHLFFNGTSNTRWSPQQGAHAEVLHLLKKQPKHVQISCPVFRGSEEPVN